MIFNQRKQRLESWQKRCSVVIRDVRRLRSRVQLAEQGECLGAAAVALYYWTRREQDGAPASRNGAPLPGHWVWPVGVWRRRKPEIDRILDGVTAHEAAQKRDTLINEIKESVQQSKKVRVGEFAKSWIESKTLKIDSTTARTYADALENHILPALGNYYYDALRPGVLRLVPPGAGSNPTSPTEGGVPGGVSGSEEKTAS